MKSLVKFYRERRGISQQKLAEIANISLTTLRNIENNRKPNTSIEIAIKLKRALHVNSVEELFNIDIS